MRNSRPSAGRPAALRSAAGPAPVPREDAPDPAALLQGQRAAECELADALARFQSEVTPATEMSLPAVVEAARGAFRLGFAYTSCRGLDEDGQPPLDVTVMHRGGDQLSSQVRLSADEAEQEFTQAARLLAQLLGIPVLSSVEQAQQSKAEALQQASSSQAAAGVTAVTPVTLPPSQEPDQAMAPVPSPATDSAPAETTQSPEATPGPAAPSDTIGPGSPDAPGTEESLRPLGDEERETLLEMIRSLRPVEARAPDRQGAGLPEGGGALPPLPGGPRQRGLHPGPDQRGRSVSPPGDGREPDCPADAALADP